MEAYKEKLKLQNCIFGIACLTLAVFAVLALGSELGWFSVLVPAIHDEHWRSTWYGYIFGSAIGVFAVMLAGLIRNILALRDQQKLKKLYVKAHDERTIQIQTLARNAAMQILLCMGLVATIIAGYFNILVSITIFICIWVSSSVSLLLMWYYGKKL